MAQIVYTTFAQRFAESFEVELRKTGVKLLIEELTRRLEALESQQTGASAPAPEATTESVQNGCKLVVENPTTTAKRKRGRKPGFKQPWSEARHEKHRLKQARRLREISENPRAQALISALNDMTGARQDSESQKPKAHLEDSQ